MRGIYARWMDRWETDLATRDNNRVIREFDWGLDWMEGVTRNGDPSRHAREFLEQAAASSDLFYSYRTPSDFRLQGDRLTFTSAVRSPYPENNTVHGLYCPVPDEKKRVVIVLPQWNSDAQGHVGLCRLLNRFGLSALRMSLAYHDYRKPAELERADYHVSSNIGRTVHASRQSVIDVRSCIDWLEQQGYEGIGILGSSLGSCVAFITAAHDARLRAGVFNHVSMNFGDVVWTGLSTRHIRSGMERHINQQQLRELWAVISPETFLPRMCGRDMKSLLIWARYDSTFLPEYSRRVLEFFSANQIKHEVFTLPCGHYTTGQFPFNIMDGLAMCRFLRKHL
jgi:hypothetical protein